MQSPATKPRTTHRLAATKAPGDNLVRRLLFYFSAVGKDYPPGAGQVFLHDQAIRKGRHRRPVHAYGLSRPVRKADRLGPVGIVALDLARGKSIQLRAVGKACVQGLGLAVEIHHRLSLGNKIFQRRHDAYVGKLLRNRVRGNGPLHVAIRKPDDALAIREGLLPRSIAVEAQLAAVGHQFLDLVLVLRDRQAPIGWRLHVLELGITTPAISVVPSRGACSAFRVKVARFPKVAPVPIGRARPDGLQRGNVQG
eukprot:scaffold3427_cov222-Pinguiococcus_pyrenoidosus.AAC.4